MTAASHDEVVSVAALGTASVNLGWMSEVRRRERIFRWSLATADMIGAAVAVFVTITLSADERLQPTYLLVMPIAALMAKLQGLYDRDELVIHKSTLDEVPRLVNLATLLALLVWLARHLIVVGAPSTEDLLWLWICLLASITTARAAARVIAGRLSPSERCFVVGDGRMVDRIRSRLAESGNAEVVGSILPDRIDITESGLLLLMHRHQAHRIIVAVGHSLDEEQTLNLVRAAKGVGLRVTVVPSILAVVGSSVVFDDLWGLEVLGIRRFGLSRSSDALKRALDLVGAGLGLLVLGPVLALIGLIVKFDSRGPVLFRQPRIGRNGEPFTILKFRTMVDGAEEMKAELRSENEAEGLFKMVDDPRVTRRGKWLRGSCLDELPQLFNVLRGEMSLVGPRPLALDEDAMITGFDRRRLTLTPGMTGHWQILGAARLPLHEMVKLDYLYVANWSLWSDVKILLRTGSYVARRRGV
jgi:exopolysaccharide biosynthesis polyprenyl glycosylphosphotransferase